MIAADIQSFDIINDVGFKGLMACVASRFQLRSRFYIETGVMRAYEELRRRVKKNLGDAIY